MNRKTPRRSSLFLLELILAIFFFCLASAVCVRFFAKSHVLSQETTNLDMAVNQTSSFAELFRSDGDFFALVTERCPDAVLASDQTTITLCYDKDWQVSSADSAAFCLTMEIKDDAPLTSGCFTMTQISDEDTIYTLNAEKYTGGDGK